ncbi:MAG: hypothetical protein E2604_06340, partial [Flavobacterium sp.]|nr:hypothetical protein [Flavobacterium sp.]
MNKTKKLLYLLAMQYGSACLAQNVPDIALPQAAVIPNYPTQTINPSIKCGQPSQPAQNDFDFSRKQQQNQMIMQEADRDIKQATLQRQAMQETQADILALRSNINYSLPSWASRPGAEYYHNAFDKLIVSDSLYSLKDNIFLIENAYFNNGLDKKSFDQIIDNCRTLLISIMNERGYDLNSNTAKNYMLFQFFSDTLQLKQSKDKHLPFTYDFEDYAGIKDHSKMFITKLLKTGSGQCHSMPLLYLILADEIGAEVAWCVVRPEGDGVDERFPCQYARPY